MQLADPVKFDQGFDHRLKLQRIHLQQSAQALQAHALVVAVAQPIELLQRLERQQKMPAMGARAGNPKRLKEDEVDLMVEPDFKLITGRQVKFEYALNLLENRVAVTKTYYEDLPQDLKKLS